jgi:hypothetical protein
MLMTAPPVEQKNEWEAPTRQYVSEQSAALSAEVESVTIKDVRCLSCEG